MTAKWSRQTYQAVADVLYAERGYDEDLGRSDAQHINGTIARLTHRFAAMFEADNPRFDRDRFKAAVYRDHEETGR